MDFGALPPEVNSAKMYVGPGSGSILAAAEFWDGIAVDLFTAASSFQSAVWGLTAGWLGPSAVLMAAAAAPYIMWMNVSATQAELTATQARAAAGAYEAAYAMTVPPPVIAENRIQLFTLIATNLFGQNTPAIAVTEFEYGEMWAQDAAAMYGYAAAAAVATETLTPFEEAPEITDAAGLVEQNAVVEEVIDNAAANQLMNAVPKALQGLASPANETAAPEAPKSLWATVSPHLGPIGNIVSMVNNHVSMGNTLLSETNTMSSMMKQFAPAATKAAETTVGTGAMAMGSMGPLGSIGPVASVGSGIGSPGVSSGVAAGLGRAISVGELSVPKGWAAANQTVTPAARALPLTNAASAAESGAGHMPGGVPVGQMGRGSSNNGINNVLRVTPRPFVMPRPLSAG